ncbi:restriction endonuclease subunit S [Candidatus Saccharibacteria bacterium]|nr:restriction endonuclease subunit S [Candidatus Saccharibacteria bacterium]
MAQLNSLIEVSSGYTFRGRLPTSMGTGDKRMILPSDLDGLNERQIKGSDLNAPTVQLVVDDVLLSNRGKFRAALISAPDDYVIPASIFILRPRSNSIHMPFLVAFLNSRAGQVALARFVQGSNIPAITKSELEGLPIPDLPLATQRQIATIAEQLASYRRMTDDKIRATEELISQLMKAENE